MVVGAQVGADEVRRLAAVSVGQDAGEGVAEDLHEEELLLTTNETGSPSYTIALTGRAQADMDGDGFEAVVAGGEDCDDARDDVYPGAPDEPGDGVVTDCDGSDEFDVDGDGYVDEAEGGEDCDDANSDINPDADETWYDGIDQDCDGNDDDQDQDGAALADDCDDTDPELIECDTGGPVGGKAVGGADCGCSGLPGRAPAGAVVAMLALAAVRRRRNPGPLDG